MGPYSGILARAAAQVAEGYGMLLWNQGGASENVYQRGNRWVVGVLTPASEYLAGLLPMVRKSDPHAATLAILRASSGEFPRAVTFGVERAAKELGFRVVLLQEYDPSQTDFGEMVGLVQRARPHVLVAVGRIDNGLGLARELANRSPAIGAVAVAATPIQQFQDALGAEAEGFLGPSQWEPGTDNPENYGPSSLEVLESLGRRGHPDLDYPMVQAYAAGLVAQRCVEAAGTLESGALRETAGALDFSHLLRTVQDRRGHGPPDRTVGGHCAVAGWPQSGGLAPGAKPVPAPVSLARGRTGYPLRAFSTENQSRRHRGAKDNRNSLTRWLGTRTCS